MPTLVHEYYDLDHRRTQAVRERDAALAVLDAILAALRAAELETGVPWHTTAAIAELAGLSVNMVSATARKFPRTIAKQVEGQRWERGRRPSQQTFIARAVRLLARW